MHAHIKFDVGPRSVTGIIYDKQKLNLWPEPNSIGEKTNSISRLCFAFHCLQYRKACKDHEIVNQLEYSGEDTLLVFTLLQFPMN